MHALNIEIVFLFEYYINYYNILFVFTWKRINGGEVMCHVRMAFSNHNNGIFKSRYNVHQFINNHIRIDYIKNLFGQWSHM